MEPLVTRLDPDTTAILSANDVSIESILLMDDEDLKDMGITNKGPRVLILNYIKEQNSRNEIDANDSTCEVDLNVSEPLQFPQDEIRAALEKRMSFGNVLQSLYSGGIPEHKGLLLMTRIICEHFFSTRIYQLQRYPSGFEKQALAVQIIKTFPQLIQTRIDKDAPPESGFYWSNQGTTSGLVQQRIANMRKQVPTEKRKFQRAKKSVLLQSVEVENEEALDLCSALEPTPLNCRQISLSLKESVNIHINMLTQTCSIHQITRKLPHLKSYGGIMAQQAYARINSAYKDVNLKSFLAKALLLNMNAYGSVQDEYIRACLVLMKEMIVRGCKRPIEISTMSPEELFAAPLIRWIEPANLLNHLLVGGPPHIACAGAPKTTGKYYVVLAAGEYIDIGDEALRAIDVFFKSFAVFNVKVPTLLGTIEEFFRVAIYKTSAFSQKVIVNKVVQVFKTVEEAESLAGSSRV